MKNPFDHLAKNVGQRALDPSGPTIVQFEISPETQHADIWHDPDPDREPARQQLGLLGRIASHLCLIEVFAHLLGGAELRGCLSKHFAHWNDRANKNRLLNRQRKRARRPPMLLVEPMCRPSLFVVIPRPSPLTLRARSIS